MDAIEYLRERGSTTSPVLLDILERMSPERYFSVRHFGALGDGVADDVLPIQAAINAAGASGGGVVFFPPGVYQLARAKSRSGLTWHLDIHFDNITLRGSGQSSKIITVANASTFFFAGMGKSVGVENWVRGYLSRLATYPIGPASAGDTKIDCENAAEFEAGDFIYIRTGQLVDGLRDQPDAEINEVVAVGGGEIFLKRPLAKSYAQEYFIEGTAGKTSATPTSNPAIFGVAKATEHLIHDLVIEHLRFESTGSAAWCCGGQLVGHRFRENSLKVAGNCWFATIHRDTEFSRNEVHVTGSGPWKAYFASDTGSSDVSIRDNLCTAERVGFIHIHEGSARVQLRNNRIMGRPSSADENSISVRGRAYDVEIADNHIVNSGKVAAIYVSSAVTGSGRVIRNTVQGTGFQDALRILPQNWEVVA